MLFAVVFAACRAVAAVAPIDGGDIAALVTQANMGDIAATLRLAKIYETGDGVDTDFVRARQLLERAAARGNAEAMRHLGALYAGGYGVARNLAETQRWWTMAAGKGDAVAMYRLAQVEADLPKALAWYRKAADAGMGRAMRDLGEIYADGKGVERDERLAAQWYLKAAKQGDALGMKTLSDIYLFGRGLPKDKSLADDWANRSKAADFATRLADADAGDNIVIYFLGVDYRLGRNGLPKDFVRSRYWGAIAAERNESNAASELAKDYLGEYGGPRDSVRAAHWLGLQLASDPGDHDAARKLADLYETGATANPAEAKRLRERIAASEANAALKHGQQARAQADARLAMTEPLDSLIKDMDHRHPVAMFFLAKRLLDAGRGDEAIFWFYLGQLRWRAHLRHNNDTYVGPFSGGEAATFSRLFETIAPEINEYAFGDVPASVAMMRKVLDWDAVHPDDFTPPGKDRDDERKGLEKLAAMMLSRQDDIRASRAKRGLANRQGPATVSVGDDPYTGSGGTLFGTPSEMTAQYDAQRFSAFHIGRTTKREIVEALGRPEVWSTDEAGICTLSYGFKRVMPVLTQMMGMVEQVHVNFRFNSKKVLMEIELPSEKKP